MERIVSLAWLAPDWITDRVDDLFRAPFWKVIGGAVIVTLALFALSASPSAGRKKLMLILFGALALAAFDLFWPSGLDFLRG